MRKFEGVGLKLLWTGVPREEQRSVTTAILSRRYMLSSVNVYGCALVSARRLLTLFVKLSSALSSCKPHGALCHPNVAELMAHVDTNARDASRRDPLCFRLCGVARWLGPTMLARLSYVSHLWPRSTCDESQSWRGSVSHKTWRRSASDRPEHPMERTEVSCNGGRHIRYETRPHDQPLAPSHWSEMN